MREDRRPFRIGPGGDVDAGGHVRIRYREDGLARPFEQRAEQADAGLGVRGRVQGGRLPGRARIGMKVGEGGRFDGEQGDLVRAYVVRVAGQLSDGVVGDDVVGAKVADMGDEVTDCFVEGSVDEPGLTGRGLGIAGVAVAEQAWSSRRPRSTERQRVRERGGCSAPRSR